MPITVYGRHTSYNVQKILWLLELLGCKYQHIELGSKPADTGSKEFGQLNPMRKVPVLVDDGRIIWESNTILRYLASMYGGPQWHQQDPYQASLVERWMDWAQTRFEPAFVGVFWGYYRTPEPQRDMKAIAKSLQDCRYCLERIDGQLGGEKFLYNDRLSLADITTGVFLYRLISIDLGVKLPGRVNSWYERLQQSAGYRQWVMSDCSSLFGRLQY